MLQPFEKFRVVYIERLIQLQKKYLVTQKYTRAVNHFSDNNKTSLLLTDYDNLNSAKVHKNALSHDPLAAIIDLSKENHKQKLLQMLNADSDYELYWSVVADSKELQKRVNLKYKDNLRRYLQKNTDWQIDRDSVIYPFIEITFGELFINLKYGNQHLRVKFSEIEKA